MSSCFVKLTDQMFTIFKDECDRWIDFFGIKNWDLSIIKQDMGNEEYCVVAALTYDVQNHVGTIAINNSIRLASPDVNVVEEIRRAAFHEVMELIFSETRELATSRYITETSVDKSIHNCIVLFENTVYKTMKVEEKKEKKK